MKGRDGEADGEEYRTRRARRACGGYRPDELDGCGAAAKSARQDHCGDGRFCACAGLLGGLSCISCGQEQ